MKDNPAYTVREQAVFYAALDIGSSIYSRKYNGFYANYNGLVFVVKYFEEIVKYIPSLSKRAYVDKLPVLSLFQFFMRKITDPTGSIKYELQFLFPDLLLPFPIKPLEQRNVQFAHSSYLNEEQKTAKRTEFDATKVDIAKMIQSYLDDQ